MLLLNYQTKYGRKKNPQDKKSRAGWTENNKDKRNPKALLPHSPPSRILPNVKMHCDL